MGRKVAEGESEVLEFIRGMIDDGTAKYCDIAKDTGFTRQQVRNFIEDSRGTQLMMSERILDVLGYELVLRKKR